MKKFALIAAIMVLTTICVLSLGACNLLGLIGDSGDDDNGISIKKSGGSLFGGGLFGGSDDEQINIDADELIFIDRIRDSDSYDDFFNSHIDKSKKIVEIEYRNAAVDTFYANDINKGDEVEVRLFLDKKLKNEVEQVDLQYGENIFYVQLKAGSKSRTYTFTITRE